MKETTNIPESKMNEIFGKTYIQNCVWLPWVVLIILLVATKLQESIRLMAWSLVGVIVTLNILYILYRLMLYTIKHLKKGNAQ